MTRVLHITRDFPPRRTGGVSTAVGALVRALGSSGIDCAVVSFDGWRPRRGTASSSADLSPALEPVPSGVDVARLSRPEQLPAAEQFARTARADVIHLHDPMMWQLAADVREATGSPIAVTVHVLHAHQNQLRNITETTLGLAGEQQALAGADRVIAPSNAVADLLGTYAPHVTSRLAVVGHPVTVPTLERSPNQAGDGPILYVGRFADINGTAELLEALPIVLRETPGTRAVIAGGVPENRRSDARWRRRWEQLAPAHIRQRVELAGWVPPDRLAALYRTASVVVSPSWFETFGLVVAEAMSYGAPIVATRIGAFEELIDHNRSGLLIEPRSPAAIARGCRRLLADPELGRRLGEAAAQTIRDRQLVPATALYHGLTVPSPCSKPE